MGNLMQNFLLLVIVSLMMYLSSIVLSWVLFHIHESSLVLNYAKHSLVMAISQYIWAIAWWALVALLFLYLKLGGYDSERTQRSFDYKEQTNQQQLEQQTSLYQRIIKQKLSVLHQYRYIVFAVVLSLAFAHSSIVLYNSIGNHKSMYNVFLKGTNHWHRNTNMDVSWPGWKYYFSDNYYGQTLARIEHSRGSVLALDDYQDLLLKLKDLHNGIYSTRSWMTNHRLLYSMLALTWKSIGIAFVITFWIFSVCAVTQTCGKLSRFVLFLLAWSVLPLFTAVSMFLRSIIAMNNHPICQPVANRGVIDLIINSNSAMLVSSMQLNVVQDPNQIYSNVCYNMGIFYDSTKLNDYDINVHVLNIVLSTLLIILLAQICALAANSTVWDWRKNQQKLNSNYKARSDSVLRSREAKIKYTDVSQQEQAEIQMRDEEQ